MAVAEQGWVEWRKSSYSGASGGECVEVGWHKSSYSDGSGGNCVEVKRDAVRVGVRDSKNVAGPTLAFPDTAWRTFLHH